MSVKQIPSFEKINYTLRPRKQIERKIIIDIFRELKHKLGLQFEIYTYLGMGSIYYYDFILFNKFLNFKNMISLDDKQCRQRFIFNKPYDFVEFYNTTTSKFLNELTRIKPLFTWFDYDSYLIKYDELTKEFQSNNHILGDIEVITKKCLPGDVFIITVDISLPEIALDVQQRKTEFIGKYRQYLDIQFHKEASITQENFVYLIQNIIINKIKSSHLIGTPDFHKLFAFSYRDSSLMYTLGGIFYPLPKEILNSEIKFIDPNENHLTKIDVPLLTYKEKQTLDRNIKFLENSRNTLINNNTIDAVTKRLHFELNPAELKDYIEYYQYYPQYYEGLI
jgi:hypothetical protein